MTAFLLDIGTLVALRFRGREFFDRIARRLQDLRPGEHELATCAITELGFVRVYTLPHYGLSVEEAKARPKSSSRMDLPLLQMISTRRAFSVGCTNKAIENAQLVDSQLPPMSQISQNGAGVFQRHFKIGAESPIVQRR